MAQTTYDYPFSDFGSALPVPPHKVDTDRLTLEIRQSAIVIALDGITTANDICSIIFKDVLSVLDVGILDIIVATHNGEPLPQDIPAPVQLYTGTAQPVPHGVNNIPVFATVKSDATKTTLYSFDWTDKTTWYPDSLRVVAEAPSSLGAGAYQLAHTDVIDTYHGLISGEDFLLDAGGFSYRVAITVDGTPQVEQDPAFGTGGDFTVDYATGVVQFLAGHEPGGGAVVLVTYHYATGSRFIIKPLPGKILSIDNVECQFAEDVVLMDTVKFQAMGPWEIFAPGAGLPPGTMIPLGPPNLYKGMRDIFNDATRAYPKYPALGGPGWRGMQMPVIICCWDYIGATLLQASLGIEIWLSLEHDIEFGGDFATATFYCTSSPEAP
jgi:hypothetical protein